jgi:hypothetical protein
MYVGALLYLVILFVTLIFLVGLPPAIQED